MPLHLLGKKSWNVYNKSNIEIVRRDEARAKAAEEAEEERMQALDATHRMQILRGEITTPRAPSLTSTNKKDYNLDKCERRDQIKKIRKRAGENDTDLEMRVAQQKVEEAAAAKNRLALPDLGIPGRFSEVEKRMKNPEAESEAARIKRSYEDQYTMRFSNAAGLNQDLRQLPWYSKAKVQVGRETNRNGKEFLCGNENQRRLEREHNRVMSNDPLLMMKSGARKAREIEKEKNRLREDVEDMNVQLGQGNAHGRRKSAVRDDRDDDVESLYLEHKHKDSKTKRTKKHSRDMKSHRVGKS